MPRVLKITNWNQNQDMCHLLEFWIFQLRVEVFCQVWLMKKSGSWRLFNFEVNVAIQNLGQSEIDENYKPNQEFLVSAAVRS